MAESTIVSTAPAARPLRADAERNRRKILDAAMELFASRGIDITLDDVARHAKVGIGTVYRRFTCKQELVDGVFEQSMDQIAEAAESALRREDPWAALVDFIGLTSEWMSLSRGLGDVFFTNDEGREQVACARQRITPAIQQLVDRAKEAGTLRPEIQVNDLFAVSCMLDDAIDRVLHAIRNSRIGLVRNPAAPRHCSRARAGRGRSSARCSHRDTCRGRAAGRARRYPECATAPRSPPRRR